MIEQGATVNDRYRVDRLIGEGGMAVVYVGHDLLLSRDVAIKALRPQYAVDPQFRTRFRREAQAAAGFSHPNIVDIYDVGEQHGTPYFVMAYIRGQTLKEVIETEGPFHPDDVAGLLQQLCAALDYAHERGFVHRDVKPQNVLVDTGGHAIVVDFGIAKGLADADLTDVGDGLGTVHYLSPEQASGLMATPASDVYAAGVIAFEMLTRALPFDAESPVAIAMRHLHEPPPAPSTILPSIPPAVDAVVLRALDKDPTRRFPSAGAFARAMTYWRQYRPLTSGADPAATRPTRPLGPATQNATRVLPAAATDQLPEPILPRVEPRTGARSGGCATWLVGLLILAGTLGLIALGVQWSSSLVGNRDQPNDPAATIVEPPAAAATFVPAIAPVETPTPEPPTPAPIEAPPTIAPLQVSVPDLVSRTTDEAAALLAEQNLQLVEGPPATSEEFPTGTVVFQDPRPGATLPPNGTVTIRLSGGPAGIDLGALDLIGLSADDAASRLGELGLAVAREEVGSADIPEGDVVSVEPSDAAVPGDTVTLQVSAGDRVQIPPDIFGSPVTNAARQLERLGLRVSERFAVDRATVESNGVDLDREAIEDGDVVGVQSPTTAVEFGDWVAPGTEVNLVYYERRGGQAP